MKKFRHVLAAVFACVMLAACFTGCGDNGGSGNNDAKEITVAVVNDTVEQNILNALIEGYKAKEGNADKKIKLIKINTSYDAWVPNKIYTNTLPDMISVYDYSSEYWTYQNLYRPITDLMTRDGINEADYFESPMSMAKSGQAGDDNYYWLPRDYNKVVVCYNTRMFEIAGVEKPQDDWTMSDFKAACALLAENADKIKAEYDQSKFWPVEMQLNWAATYYPFVKSYGGDLFDFENETVFKNLDKVKKAFNVLLEYADEPTDEPYRGTGYSFPPDDDKLAFANKQAAMIFTSRPNIQRYAANLDNNIDFVSMPIIEDRETEQSYVGMGCTGYAITKTCADDKLELAWDFLKYIVSEDGQEVLGALGSGVPVLKSLASDENAAWRTFISKDLNHEAFVKYPERDLAMNYYKGFKVSKQLGLYTELQNKLLKAFYETDDRDAYYAQFKSDIEKLLK